MAYGQMSYDPWETPPEERKARFVGREALLERLLDPALKCALVITGVESREESEQVYDAFKSRIEQLTRAWPDDHNRSFQISPR